MKPLEKIEETKQQKVSFQNDVLFKHFFIGMDEDSIFLRHTVIGLTTNIMPKRTEVCNPEMIPKQEGNKRIIMDIHLRDEEMREYNIEMQSQGLLDTEFIRFQYYSAHMLVNQLQEGDDYSNLKVVHQITFFDHVIDDDHQLVNHYVLMKSNGRKVQPVMIHMYFISLPEINRIEKEKGLEHMNALELMCYLFKNGITSDILKIDERPVKVMIKKYEELRKNKDLWSFAVSHEIAECRDRNIKEELCQKAEERGLLKGKQQEKYRLIKHQIKKKYGKDETTWLKTLNQTQLEHITEFIFDYDSIEELKVAIEQIGN